MPQLGADLAVALHQPDGGTGGAEADGHLRADGVIVEMGAEIPLAEAGALVSTVEANLLSEQTGADTDLYLVHGNTPCISIESVIAVIQENGSCITIAD